MNAYYSANNSEINQVVPYKKAKKKMSLAYVILERIFCFLDMVIDFFSQSAVKTVVKLSAISVCFFSFLCIICSIEAGTLSIGMGVIISMLLVFIEVLLLRKA